MNEVNAIDYWYQKYLKEKLTWEDVRSILNAEKDILDECNNNVQQVMSTYPKEEDYYGEILRRFNKQRKK